MWERERDEEREGGRERCCNDNIVVVALSMLTQLYMNSCILNMKHFHRDDILTTINAQVNDIFD